MPDLILCVDGTFVAMEVKRPKKDPEPIQEEELREVERSGGCAVVVRSLEEAKEVIAEIRSNKLFFVRQSAETGSRVQPPHVRSLATCATTTSDG